MKVYQIITENTLKNFKRKFSNLSVQDQAIFKELISVRRSDVPQGTRKEYKGNNYTWNSVNGHWKKDNGRKVDPDNSPLHLTLFVDKKVSTPVFELYQEAKQADEIKNLDQELNKSTVRKTGKVNKPKKDKGKKSRIGNLVRDMQRATGRAGPSKDPGDGPD